MTMLDDLFAGIWLSQCTCILAMQVSCGLQNVLQIHSAAMLIFAAMRFSQLRKHQTALQV